MPHRLAPSFLLISFGAIASAQVPTLDPIGLGQALKAGKWAVIEFGGPTCIPCKKMQPILEQVQQQFGDRALVRNFYVTQFPQEARAHKVMAMPTQVVFDPGGKEVLRHVGFWEKGDFVAALTKVGLK